MARSNRHRTMSFLTLPLLAALVVGACGVTDTVTGGETGSEAAGDTAGDTASDTASDTGGGDGAADTGGEPAESADCSLLTAEDVTTFGFNVQLLAQVSRPDQVEAVGEGLGYEPDGMADILARMHTVLDGRPAEGYDDPRDAIAFYEDLNERLRVLLETPPPVPQGLIDEYVSVSGGIAGGLGRQLPINAALVELCPGLLG